MPARRMTRRLPIPKELPIRRRPIFYKDTGFQGYDPAVKEDTPGEKKSRPEGNSPPLRSERTGSWPASASKWSMPFAGVKRCRIVKDVLRNTKEGVSDAAMEAACGLHNLRVQNRKPPLRR